MNATIKTQITHVDDLQRWRSVSHIVHALTQSHYLGFGTLIAMKIVLDLYEAGKNTRDKRKTEIKENKRH